MQFGMLIECKQLSLFTFYHFQGSCKKRIFYGHAIRQRSIHPISFPLIAFEHLGLYMCTEAFYASQWQSVIFAVQHASLMPLI